MLSIDLREQQVVYAWEISVQRCRADDAGGEPDPTGSGNEQLELWLANGDGTQTLVEKSCGRDPATAFLNPYLTPETLVYGAITTGVRWWVRTYRPASGQYAEGRTVNGVLSYVQFGETAWRARRASGTRIERVPALRLAPAQAYPSTSEIGPPVGTTVPSGGAR